jgi:hypothetical protein
MVLGERPLPTGFRVYFKIQDLGSKVLVPEIGNGSG